MAEQTIAKSVMAAIKKKEGIKYSEMAERIGVPDYTLKQRTEGDVRLSNFWELVKGMGYDMVFIKTPDDREPMMSVGETDCHKCAYKKLGMAMVVAYNEASAEMMMQASTEDEESL